MVLLKQSRLTPMLRVFLNAEHVLTKGKNLVACTFFQLEKIFGIEDMKNQSWIMCFLMSIILITNSERCFAYSHWYRNGDLNRDCNVDILDVAYYFKNASLIHDSLEVPDSITQRLDFNGDGEINIEDTKIWVLLTGGGSFYDTAYFNPVYPHPDSIPQMSEAALTLAREQLTKLIALWPDKRAQLNRILRQFALADSPPVPVNMDLTGDGYIDAADIVRFFTLLADSLAELPGLTVVAGMDFNVDDRVDLLDTENLFWSLYTDTYRQEICGDQEPWNRFIQTHESAAALKLSENARRFASSQIAWVLEKEQWAINGYMDVYLKDFCEVFGLPFPPPRPWPGDIDADSLRTAADAAQFFNFMFDKAPAGMYREDLDFNLDSRVDSLDAEYFLFFLFREGRALSTPSGQSMSRNSLRRTISFLEDMENRHPEWVDQSGKSMLGPLLQALLPLPVTDSLDADLNQDGRVNILDLLTFLRWGAQGDSRADWSGDNAFTGEDILMFLGRLQR